MAAHRCRNGGQVNEPKMRTTGLAASMPDSVAWLPVASLRVKSVAALPGCGACGEERPGVAQPRASRLAGRSAAMAGGGVGVAVAVTAGAGVGIGVAAAQAEASARVRLREPNMAYRPSRIRP